MPYKKIALCFGAIILSCVVSSCNRAKPTLFTLIDPTQSHVWFSNDLHQTQALNILNYLYFYNGGGVSIGDVNNDKLPDIYFTSNQGANKLYLNRGNFVFEDITKQAGVADSVGWKTGTTMVDIDGDHDLDIYVCHVDIDNTGVTNKLFINNNDGTFSEKAHEFGLNHHGYATQICFFDYDNDNDLDAYLLNHSLRPVGALNDTILRTKRDAMSGDKLYENRDGHFTDVSERAGITGSSLGYGLGIAVADLNNDGFQDLYISNDFHENDLLYYNNGDGTFSEQIHQAMPHVSYYSMGNDIADINNDGLLDVVTLDMMPEQEQLAKASAGTDTWNVYRYKRNLGFLSQSPRNALQLNVGNNKFKDVARMSGISATDWSWCPLVCDFDNDGFKDLFITNGIVKRPNNLDYFKYISNNEVQQLLRAGVANERMSVIDKMPDGKASNYVYHNNGDLTFSDSTITWGLSRDSFSNGAAYADLDNDGDLDLVVNNIAEPAFIYRNESDQTKNHFLKISLLGSSKNTFGIGVRVDLYGNGKQWSQQQMPTRGFESSVEPVLLFGLGNLTAIDSVHVRWPDNTSQVIKSISSNQTIVLKQVDAVRSPQVEFIHHSIFKDVTDSLGLDFIHHENSHNDFDQEPLMPYMLSAEGPCLEVADVNGDGLDDFFVGAAKGFASELFVLQRDGSFRSSNRNLFNVDSGCEDVASLFFDADQDGDQDLYVVSGSHEFNRHDEALVDRLYLNDGKGNYTKALNAIPPRYANGSCVRAGDYDHDGDLDLFVGSRSMPGQYGLTPESCLLENVGNGKFREVINSDSKPLRQAGMVNDAVWIDIDGDSKPELIVVGEWMPVRVFKFQPALHEITSACQLTQTEGWWHSIYASDVDGDGDLDLLVGNQGLNSPLKASLKQPLFGYFKDFDDDGVLDPIIAYHKQDKLYPLASRDELTSQIVALKKRYSSYQVYAHSTFPEIFSTENMKGALTKEVTTFSSSLFRNDGHAKFIMEPLPAQAQTSPIKAWLALDIDHDNKNEFLAGGNMFLVAPSIGRLDASYGYILKGNNNSTLDVITEQRTGFYLTGEVHALKSIRIKNKYFVLSARNNLPLQVFKLNR